MRDMDVLEIQLPGTVHSMRYVRSFGFGVVAGAAGAASFLYLYKVRSEDPKAGKSHIALRYGSPAIANTRHFENFVVAFDTKTRNPQWVLEYVTRQLSRGEGNRKNVEFREDVTFEERFRSHLSDFKASGYDRGHLAPAANHKSSQKAMEETFLLTNISPQVGKGFNRDYWARFERFVKEVAYASSEVFIVTGPLYLPQRTPHGFELRHPVLGEPPNMVSVPTHFFKVILRNTAEPHGGLPESSVAAFVMPNAAIEPDLPLTAFAVPLEALEAAAGLNFFPSFISKERRRFHDRAALVWQARGSELALKRAKDAQQLPHLEPTHRQALDLAPLQPFKRLDTAQTAKNELPLGLLEANPEEVLRREAIPEAIAARRGQTSTDVLHIDAATGEGLRSRSHSAPAAVAVQDEGSRRGKLDGPGRHSVVAVRPPGAENQHQDVIRITESPEQRRQEGKQIGMMHLCDCLSCQLPPPDWYLKRQKAVQHSALQ